MSKHAEKDDRSYDPVYVNSTRETTVLLLAFVVFLVWTVGAARWFGYGTTEQIIGSRIWGMPSWVVWSVLVPWGAATLFTFWFAWFFMKNDELGKADDEVNS